MKQRHEAYLDDSGKNIPCFFCGNPYLYFVTFCEEIVVSLQTPREITYFLITDDRGKPIIYQGNKLAYAGMTLNEAMEYMESLQYIYGRSNA